LHSEDVETDSIAPAVTAVKRRPQPALARGACVGRYVILDQLGLGGMGVVYRAYDPDLDRRVALKLVRAVSEDATARLVREAQALAKVSHPNIVQIFDVGVFGDTVFIAMELVEGRTLSKWTRETKPECRPLLAHLIEAGRGLSAAHAAGLVHRDFKPQNVIVGEDGRVRVLDFGVARLAVDRATTSSDDLELDASSSGKLAAFTGEPDTGVATALERPRARTHNEDDLPRFVVSRLTGTPIYMAPEQRRPGMLDARADQFSFAVTCWELLHGVRPFQGEDEKAYLAASARGTFRPPAANNATPMWVRRALQRAMSPKADERYRTMDDLLAALAADPARRRQRIATIAAGVVLAGAATIAIATRTHAATPCEDAAQHLAGVWDASVADRLAHAFHATGASFADDTATKVRAALDHRADAWITMHREACRATRVSAEQSAALLDLRMGCLDRRRQELHALVDQLVTAPDPVRVAAAVEAVERLPPIAACADRDALTAVVPLPSDLAQQTLITALRTELAATRALLTTGQWPEAERRAVHLEQRAQVIGWAPLVAEVAELHGQVERHLGDVPAAEAAFHEAVAAAARAHEDAISSEAWSDLAWVVGYEQERPAEGLAFATAAEAVAVRTDAPMHELASIAQTRALIWSTKGDQEAALREARRALVLADRDRVADPTQATDMIGTIAMIETTQGDYPHAEQTLRDVLARRRSELGEGHPKVADALDNLGVVRFHQGAYAEARRDYEQALAMRTAALGADARDVGTSHNNLGGLLMDIGDDRGAAAHLEAALRIYEHVLGPEHADLAIPLSNLGELATRRADFTLAIHDCERALALDTRSGPDDPQLAFDLVCIGEAQLGRRDLAAARTVLERALDLREHGGGDAGELARTRFDLAKALSDRARARRLAIQARDGFATAGEQWQVRHAETIAWLASHGARNGLRP
jgi:tetratricopeptide (TPR) repeat protein/tRNA A-37 threonylcarbamoyl transferase component Bud32